MSPVNKREQPVHLEEAKTRHTDNQFNITKLNKVVCMSMKNTATAWEAELWDRNRA